MRFLLLGLTLILAAGQALAAPAPQTHPFDAEDLAMMSRVSDPQLAPDDSQVAFSVRETDYAANKGITSIWMLDLKQPGAKPRKIIVGNSPRWSPDGKTL